MAHSRLHKVLLVSSMLLILLISDLQRVASKDGEEAPNFTKMRVKELQALLDERGVVCNGCAEKADLVKRVEETFHLPLKKEEPAVASESKDKKPKMDDKELDDLLKKLGGNKNGGPGFKVFRPEDFAGLSPEEMGKKFGKGEL